MVSAALTLALGAYLLTILHRLETYEPKFNRTDYTHVVVAGAWRLPNKTLSATFARRVDRGDEPPPGRRAFRIESRPDLGFGGFS